MNLKNKLLLKKLLKWANKKQNNCCIFLKKIKKNTCRYHYQNLDDMIYSSWDIKQNILKLVILDHFLPFYPPKNPKNQNFEKWKNLQEISSFYTCVKKITIIWCVVSEVWSETNFFCHFGPIFALLPPTPNDPENQILKKNVWRYYPFIHTCVP